MAASAKTVDPAFHGVGQKVGLDVWRIEDFQPVLIPKSDHGKFYSGDSYIVLKSFSLDMERVENWKDVRDLLPMTQLHLEKIPSSFFIQTSALKSGGFQFDLHFWLGKDTSQDESGTAAIKTVELDVALGGRAVQYRELQGYETDRFLSYFKPCIIPLDGGVASGFKKVEVENYETRLYVCKGKRVAHVKQVPFVRSSLNHDDVFILDTESKIFQFNGSTSNIQERAKSLQVVQYIKDTYHEGKCEVAIIEDGKLVAEGDSGEFWGLFGGFAPIGKKAGNDNDPVVGTASAKLYSLADGNLNAIEATTLSKGLLDSKDCYLLDCGSDVFLWVGRETPLDERKAATLAAEEFLTNQKRPKSVRLTRVIQGFESLPFRTQFEEWPLGNGTDASEEGRGKVSALLKQQALNFRGTVKAPGPAKEEIPPLLDSNGKLEVWRIDGTAKSLLPSSEAGKFYSGDCYLVLYTYPGERKDEYYLCYWIGKHSVVEEQTTALSFANQMTKTLKGRPVQGQIYEGKEPAQFLALFKGMFILKGGTSSGYKKTLSENDANDETYIDDGMALFRVQGIGCHNSKAVQVDTDAESLSSAHCFILQSGTSIFLWNGSATTLEEQQRNAKMAELLKPGTSFKILKEGSEPSSFWIPLGGKKSYSNKPGAAENGKDLRLFSCNLVNGMLEVSEVFNYAEDDLLSEDVMILDTSSEIFVWIGQHADPKEKQQASEIAQKYVEKAAATDGIPLDVPIFQINEGNEPVFFTRYFSSWDSSKVPVPGNSYEKRLSTVLNHPIQPVEVAKRRPFAFEPSEGDINEKVSGVKEVADSEQSGPTQRAAAIAALSSAFNAAGVVESKNAYARIPSLKKRPVAADENDKPIDSPVSEAPLETEAVEVTTSKIGETVEDNVSGSTQEEEEALTEGGGVCEEGEGTLFSYEQLQTSAAEEIAGIDPTKRESYLSAEEFKTVFKIEKEQFYQLPKWKQDKLKMALGLF